jgi:predicted helicase
MKYVDLDESVRKTYAKLSASTNTNAIYDTYFKAFRWASNRLKEQGVICFVTNGSWIDSNSADGFRKSLEQEFSSIYVFNLRGNARTSGEQRRLEAGNVFGEGSRTPVTITLLIKNPNRTGSCEIFYHDIGDSLNREEKLKIVANFGNIEEIPWSRLIPNDSGDWINQRDETYSTFIPLGDKESKGKEGKAIFRIFSMGIQTTRDSWDYNFNKRSLAENVRRMIKNYNDFVSTFKKGKTPIEELTRVSKKDISWSRDLLKSLQNGKEAIFQSTEIVLGNYRPFHKMWLYREKLFVGYRAKTHVLFPEKSENLLICTTGPGASVDFSALISNLIPNYHFVDTGQAFPLYYYPDSKTDDSEQLLFGNEVEDSKVDAISDWALELFKQKYGSRTTKEDIFYYVYGVLSAPQYITRYKNELRKDAARVPLLEAFRDYCDYGRKLADLQLNFENFSNDFVKIEISQKSLDSKKLYRVEKMRFGKNSDKSVISYNQFITLSEIPLDLYSYSVNGKSPIEWVMDRYVVKEDADSGIINDPNSFSEDAKYVLNLLLSVMEMTRRILELQKSLPKLVIPE